MTEYFVTHYKITYPECRTAGNGDKPVKKHCFTCKGCMTASKSKTLKRNVCNRKKLKGGCEQFDCLCSGRYPYICITEPCPKSQRVANCRVSIGLLDDEEKELFETETGISTMPDFSMENPRLSTLKEKSDHKLLIENYEKLETIFETHKSFEEYTKAVGHYPDHFEFLLKCRNIAERTRALRQTTIEVNPSSINTFALDQGGAQTATIEQTLLLGSVTKTATTAISNEPTKVHLVNADDIANKMKDSFVSAMCVFHDPLHETEAEKWDRISRDKFNGEGWAEMARMNLNEQGIKPITTMVRNESDRIRQLVKRYRLEQ